jgi:tRNA(His) 5'-end guanylyltransferase
MGTLTDRMKLYEGAAQTHLTRRMPCLLRLDGRAFHSYTRGLERPWDVGLERCMQATMLGLCEEVAGCVLGYQQSDEISLLLVDYMKFETMPWFDNNVQKLVSVAASIATQSFLFAAALHLPAKAGHPAHFDARAFALPREEVNNYFVWRQQDAVRNSILGLGQAHFSPRQLHGQNTDQIQEMLWQEHHINWSQDTPTYRKRGATCRRVSVVGLQDARPWQVDLEPPTFSVMPGYVDQWVWPQDEQGADR